MLGKIAIVTGANTGIGKETARGLATLGATVVLACRDVQKGNAARADILRSVDRDDVTVMALDLADAASIDAFGEEFMGRYPRLDVLVNNAGVYVRRRTTIDGGLERTFGVNHVGTSRLTLRLLELLKRSAPSRIVVVASGLHFRGRMMWDDLQFERRSFNGVAAYNQSKLANVLFTKALARRLAGTGVTVNALHPGVVATELTRAYPRALIALLQLFLLTPAQGASCSIHVASAPELAGVTGEYFVKSRATPASAEACDESAQERLWTVTQELSARPDVRSHFRERDQAAGT